MIGCGANIIASFFLKKKTSKRVRKRKKRTNERVLFDIRRERRQRLTKTEIERHRPVVPDDEAVDVVIEHASVAHATLLAD